MGNYTHNFIFANIFLHNSVDVFPSDAIITPFVLYNTMNKNIYLILALIGLILPYHFLFRFLGENGLNVSLLIAQLFANEISTFFAVDLVISIVVFWFYVQAEAEKLRMKNVWLYILASVTIGLSFALPLFLYFRKLRTLELRKMADRKEKNR